MLREMILAPAILALPTGALAQAQSGVQSGAPQNGVQSGVPQGGAGGGAGGPQGSLPAANRR